jgi:L-alanine-DL-glutamate epimerase-like enolase superfamily enzyme
VSASLRELRARELRIPFRTRFSHASADRAETSTIWAEAIAADGTVGYGESCPRPYVTAESIDSALAFLHGRRDALVRDVRDMPAMRAWVSAHAAAIDSNPAAWCAIELALLDLFGKAAGLSVEALMDRPAPRGPFRFSAVVGDVTPETCAALVGQYRDRGFTDFKIKLSGDPARDRAKLAALRLVPGARVRADANNLWDRADDAIAALRALDHPLSAIEEPIGAGQFHALAFISDSLGCPIVLDESVLREEQLLDLPGPPERWIVNVRVSKMGGLLRSFAVVQRAREAGFGIIVGAQVGETSLLTRAALSVAAAAGDRLFAQEGAFGTHLLQYDVCDPPLMFGPAGALDPSGVIDVPGFGLSIVDSNTRQLG